MNDLFLKILNNEIPSTKVYEDENVFAILDINPHNKGHLLVIPKEKYKNILDIPENILSNMIIIVKKLAKAVYKATNADGINISMNNEAAAGQEVMHAHIHIVPRFKNDGVYKAAKHTSYSDGEKEEVALKIRNCIETSK